MKKQVNYNLTLNIGSIVVIVAMAVLSLTLAKPLSIVCAVIGFVVCVAFLCLAFVLKRKAIKQLEEEKENSRKKVKKQSSLLDTYAILGIPPQYKPNGELKNIYELLGIKPQFDETGKRLLTIYELLGVNPKFTQGGVERPSVLRIKNRVNSLIKLEKGTAPLIYYPRHKQIIGDKHILDPQVKAPETDKNAKPEITAVKVVKPAAKPQANKSGDKPKYGKITEVKGTAAIVEYKIKYADDGKKTKIDVKPVEPSKNSDEKEKVSDMFKTAVAIAGAAAGVAAAAAIQGAKGVEKVATAAIDATKSVAQKAGQIVTNIGSSQPVPAVTPISQNPYSAINIPTIKSKRQQASAGNVNNLYDISGNNQSSLKQILINGGVGAEQIQHGYEPENNN